MGLGAVPPTNLKCVFVPPLTFQTRVHPDCTPRQELNNREESIPKEKDSMELTVPLCRFYGSSQLSPICKMKGQLG